MAVSPASSWISDPSETRGPMLTGVFLTLVSLSGIVLALRLYVRFRHDRFQIDDCCLIIGWFSLLAFVILSQLAVNLGFGNHALDVSFNNLDAIALYGAAGLTMSIIGINAAKISFAVTLLQLTRDLWRWTNWAIWFIIVTLIMFAVPVAVLPWVQCNPLVKTFVDFWPGTCIDKSYSVRFAMFQGIYSAATDFFLAALPWKIIWALQMRPIEKFGVGFAMSMGIVAGVMAIMRSITVVNLSSQDLSYDGALSSLWAGVELTTTIIAACIPVLRRFIQDQVTERSRGSGGSSKLKSSLRSNNSGQCLSQKDSNSGNDIRAYQLSRLSGKLDGLKTNGRWFAVIDENDEHSEESSILRGAQVSPHRPLRTPEPVRISRRDTKSPV